MAYVANLHGYINDVPLIWFKRTDGKVFHFDQISDASATPNVNFTEVNGGWSLYPKHQWGNIMVAYLPAASTMLMSFTSVQFNADLFAMANDTDFADKTVTEYVTGSYLVAGNQIQMTVPTGVLYSDFIINGMTAINGDTSDTTPATSQFEVARDGETTTVTVKFNATDNMNGKTIEVTYKKSTAASVIEVDNTKSAAGELILKYPK